MMTKYLVHWFHAPSGKFGTSEHDCITNIAPKRARPRDPLAAGV
jgi:hypothetical protein